VGVLRMSLICIVTSVILSGLIFYRFPLIPFIMGAFMLLLCWRGIKENEGIKDK